MKKGLALLSKPILTFFRSWLQWSSYFQAHTQPQKMPSGRYNILIADLANDTQQQTQSEHLSHALKEWFTTDTPEPLIAIQRGAQMGPLGTKWDAEIEHMECRKKAHKQLENWNANLLIWGEIDPSDQHLKLHLTPGREESAHPASRYDFNHTLKLPPHFDRDIGRLLTAQLVARIFSPGLEEAEKRDESVALVRRECEALGDLLTDQLDGFLPDQQAELQFSYGLVAACLGAWTKEKTWYELAVKNWRSVGLIWSRKTAPFAWARVQNNLGVALGLLGARDQGPERLEQALEAYEEALKGRPRETMPHEWARSQNNRAHVLHLLGIRKRCLARLEQSVGAYQEVLKEWTRKTSPSQWQWTQYGLAAVLSDLGSHDEKTENLEAAVNAFRASLQDVPRKSASLNSGKIQNDLGHTLAVLATREENISRMEEAIEVFRTALNEFKDRDSSHDWALTQNNLGNALQVLGEWQGDQDLIAEAQRTLMTARTAIKMSDNYTSGSSN